MSTTKPTKKRTPREAVTHAFGANCFASEFVDKWQIENATFSKNKSENAVQEAKDWCKDKRADGWTTKRKSYSMFVSCTAVRPKGE